MHHPTRTYIEVHASVRENHQLHGKQTSVPNYGIVTAPSSRQIEFPR